MVRSHCYALLCAKSRNSNDESDELCSACRFADEKRKRIIFELLDTEKTYKDFLVKLVEVLSLALALSQ
jgi:hypothetical protein